MTNPVDTVSAGDRYLSATSMRAAHGELLESRRLVGDSPEFLDDVAAFIRRGRATGALLLLDEERWSSQSLLDFWANLLYRAGREPPEATLAEFDPALAPVLPDALCPYLGLDAFGEADRDRLFGRERLIGDLVSRIEHHRLIAVVGPSGSGKSSLVQAGVLPALKRGVIAESDAWRYYSPMVPGSAPLVNLARITRPPTEDTTEWVPRHVEGFTHAPTHLLQLINERGDVPAILVVDQFEEIFTLCTDDHKRLAFIENLLHLAQAPGPRHTVLLTMRSDFESNVAKVPALQALFEVAEVRVTPLSAGELREAIEKPAERVGLRFEEGIVDELIREVLGEPAALPLLQFTLLKLWENRNHNLITWDAYRRLGGGRLALSRSADAFYEGLIPEEQVTTKRIMLQLVRPGEGLEVTSNRVRRDVLYLGGEARDRVDRVLDKLVRARLVRLTEGDTLADAQVEVAHEAVVRNWGKFVDWLNDERDRLRKRRRLTAAADQWNSLGKNPTVLLRGVLLEEAERYEDLDKLESEFIRASRTAVEEAEREKEAARQRELELEHARALEAEKRKTVSARALAAVSVLIALTLVSAVEVWKERDRARMALLREVVAIAINNLDIDPELSILLALHATQGAPAVGERVTSEAVDALGRAVSASRVRWTLPTDAADAPRVAYNHDGTLLATTGKENTVTIWNADTGKPLHPQPLSGHTALVLDIAFASQDNRLATASQDKTAQVWDATSGNPSFPPLKHEAEVVSVAFSPNGRVLATADADGFLRLWDAATGKLARPLKGCKHEGVTSISFSPDGKYLATASTDKTVAVWNVNACKERFRLRHDDQVLRIRFSPDGTLLATASMDGTAKIWDAETGKQLHTLIGHTNTVFDVAFSPHYGNRIATASADTTVRVYDTDSGRYLFTLAGHRKPVESLAFSPDETRVATASWDRTAKVWDVGGLTDVIHSVAFSEDGQRLATAASDGTSPVWDTDTWEVLLYGHIHEITAIALSPKGDRIATGNKDGEVKIWDVGSRKLMHTLDALSYQVTAISFNQGGDRVAAAGSKTVAIWNAETGALLPFKLQHDFDVTSLAFSRDGLQLATGDAAGMVKVWVTATGKSHELPGHTRQVFNVVFSPNGEWLASASQDHSARLWNLASKDGASRKLDHEGMVLDVAFSPDGTHLVTVSEDRTAKVWDIASEGRPLIVLRGHESVVANVAFSPDGRRLATGSWDKTVRVWDGHPWHASSKQELLKLRLSDQVMGIGFSADGKRLTAVSADGKVRVHFFEIEKLREFASTRVTRKLTPEECNVYLEQPCP